MGLREDYQRGKGRGSTQTGPVGYQGKEITSTIQAPTREALEDMLGAMRHYSSRQGLGPVKVLESGPDPDGGYRATLVAHNFNPLKWAKEKFKERGEEKEYKERRKAGQVPPEEMSPREQKEEVEANRRRAEEAAKAAAKARARYREEVPSTTREAVRAREESLKAGERTRTLETELHGEPLRGVAYAVFIDPTTSRETGRRRLGENFALRQEEHIEYGPPVRQVRGPWGKMYEVPFTMEERELEARKGLARRGLAPGELELQKAEQEERLARLKERQSERKKEKVMGPVREIVKGVAGTVEGIGRELPMGVRTGPYRPVSMPSPVVTPRPSRPSGPPVTGFGPSPQAPDLSHLRSLQMQTPKIRQPSKPKPSGQPKGKNTYNEQMRRMRKLLFGG